MKDVPLGKVAALGADSGSGGSGEEERQKGIP